MTFLDVRLVTILIDALLFSIIMLRLWQCVIYQNSFSAKTITIPVDTVASRIGNETITFLGPKPSQYRAAPTLHRAKSYQSSTLVRALGIFLPGLRGTRSGRGEYSREIY